MAGVDFEFIAIELQGDVRGRRVQTYKATVRRNTEVRLLRELVETVLCVKGALTYQEKNITQKQCTLEDLKIGNGAVLKIKNFQQMSRGHLKSVSLYVKPQGEWCTIKVPMKITIRMLKFLIESEQKILMSHLAIKTNERLEDDSYECSREELKNVEIEDTSRRQPTPQPVPQPTTPQPVPQPTQQHGSPTTHAPHQSPDTNIHKSTRCEGRLNGKTCIEIC
jgi:hypothetical protein